MRFLRLLPLLLAVAFAPLAFAQSADVLLTMTMPSTAIDSSGSGASATGHFTVTNKGPWIAQNVTIDFGPNAVVTSDIDLYGFTCGLTNGRHLCTAVSLVPGSTGGTFQAGWPEVPNGTVETTTVTVTSSSPEDPDPTNNSVSANTTIVWQADLQLKYVGGLSPIAPGANVVLAAQFSNYGPSAATGVKVTVSVPPGTAYQGYFAPDGYQCTEPPQGGQGDLVCSAPNIGLVQWSYVGALVQVDPAAGPGTVVTFSATLASTDAIKPVQSMSASITVAAPADLHAEISAPASAMTGDTFLTTMTVTNRGPGSAAQTRVTYSQTGGGVYGPIAAPAGWSCGATSCMIDSFAAGATATFTIPTTIPTNLRSGTLTGTLDAGVANETNSADNSASVQTVIIPRPQAALKLTLSASPDVVYHGDQLTYTAKIANTSNIDAQEVWLDWGTLPGTVLATTCGTADYQHCMLGTLAAGATQTATSTIRVDAGAATVLTESAMVGGTNVAYDYQSESASVSTTVAGTSHVDLAPGIFGPAWFHAGTTGAWMYGISNHGPDTATDWQLSLPLPANTTLASFTVAGGTCSGLTPNAANTVVTCHGTSLPFQLVLHLAVPPGTTAPIHATASVSTTNIDSNPQNDTVAVDTPIYQSAELSSSVTADKTAAVTGERVTQTFTVTNMGPDAATGAVLDVTLPDGAVFATMSSTFASCTGTGPIHCTAPPLVAGDTLSAAISFQAPGSVGFFQTKSRTSWNNSASPSGYTEAYTGLEVIAPPPAADVTLTIDATPIAPIQPGDDVAFTLAATNVGISPAAGVTLQFDLPAALELLSAPPQCTGTQTITCTAGTLSSGSWATFTVTARAVAAGMITVTAAVNTTSPEANSGNNTGSATVVVNAVPQSPPARRRAARH